jgi:hypothetical protein
MQRRLQLDNLSVHQLRFKQCCCNTRSQAYLETDSTQPVLSTALQPSQESPSPAVICVNRQVTVGAQQSYRCDLQQEYTHD